MNMKKEIFASIEIADHEIRCIVGEFHETRFHVLRVERANIEGISHKQIIDEQNVVNGIIKCVRNAEEALEMKFSRVILLIPSVDVERQNKRIQIIPEASSKRIMLSDIQKGIHEAKSFPSQKDLELVNLGCIKYITNGITSRKMPLDEACETFVMSIDLLYANQNIVYDYARCIEKSGLDILDICLDSFAAAQEAAVFEQTLDKYVILIDIARQDTTLSLFSHGKLVNCECLPCGSKDWIAPIMEAYQLNEAVSFRLLQNTCHLFHDVSDEIIYIWAKDNEQKQVIECDISNLVEDALNAWLFAIQEASAPIVEDGEVKFLIIGSGSEIQGFPQVMKRMNGIVQTYVPQTIGARESVFTAALGAFYSWKEQKTISQDDRTSCDSDTLADVSLNVKKRDENGFTRKLRNMLLNDN